MKKASFKKSAIILLVILCLFLVIGLALYRKKSTISQPVFTVHLNVAEINISSLSQEYERVASPSNDRFALVFNEDQFGVAVFDNDQNIGTTYISKSAPYRPIHNLRWIDETTIEYEICMSPYHAVLIQVDLLKQEVIKAIPQKKY
jgi:hypothetical protein